MVLGVLDLTYFSNNFVDLFRDKYLGGYCIEWKIKASSIKTHYISAGIFYISFGI